jgi:hypothetical protein
VIAGQLRLCLAGLRTAPLEAVSRALDAPADHPIARQLRERGATIVPA